MAESSTMQVFDITASALSAERARVGVIARNLANADVTGTAANPPYRRQRVLFESVLEEAIARRGGGDGLPAGAARVRVADAPGDYRRLLQPSHPDADAQGYVLYSNVNVVEEMVDLVDAARSYEANLSALRTWRRMLERTIEMTR
jgi:flagellar basal-body rod protein FlgC